MFGGFIPLAATSAAAFWVAPLAPFQKPLAFATAVTGLLGVLCSAMIYADTHREFWRASQSLGKFFGTTLLLGAATTLVVTGSASLPLVALLVAGAVVKLAFEQRIYRDYVNDDALRLTALNKTARLLTGELRRAARLRVTCGVMGGVVLPLLFAMQPQGRGLMLVALALCVVGEWLERYLFFTAVAPVKMPGGVGA